MAATLSGNILGSFWSCGKEGNGKLFSAMGDAAINSEKYDSAFELENDESCTRNHRVELNINRKKLKKSNKWNKYDGNNKIHLKARPFLG